MSELPNPNKSNFTILNNNDNLTYITASYIEQYGFCRFVRVYMKDINMKNKQTRECISAAVDINIEDTKHFRALFKDVLRETMEENDFSYDEALDFIYEGNYVIPTHVAFAFALDFTNCDVETLNELIIARAEYLLVGA